MDKIASPRQFIAAVQGLLDYAHSAGPSREVMAARLADLANRVAGRMLVASHTPLYGHDSEANAYVVDDYPYGFKLRTKIRYWLEMKPGKGFRFMSQTLNPKTQRWNAAKKETYVSIAASMYLNEKEHVDWDVLTEYSKPSEALEFVKKYPQADLSILKRWTKAKLQHLEEMISGKRYMTMNGEKVVNTEEDVGRMTDDLKQWGDVATHLH